MELILKHNEEKYKTMEPVIQCKKKKRYTGALTVKRCEKSVTWNYIWSSWKVSHTKEQANFESDKLCLPRTWC